MKNKQKIRVYVPPWWLSMVSVFAPASSLYGGFKFVVINNCNVKCAKNQRGQEWMYTVEKNAKTNIKINKIKTKVRRAKNKIMTKIYVKWL